MMSWDLAGVEPGLDEILGDPIVRAIMHCDGLGEREVREVVARASGSLAVRQGATVARAQRSGHVAR